MCKYYLHERGKIHWTIVALHEILIDKKNLTINKQISSSCNLPITGSVLNLMIDLMATERRVYKQFAKILFYRDALDSEI